MSRLCSTSSSSGSLLAKLAPRQVLPLLYPNEIALHERPQIKRRSRSLKGTRSAVIGLETWFITSLANASRCHRHTLKATPSSSFFTSRRPDAWRRSRQIHNSPINRSQHTDGTYTAPADNDILENELVQADDRPPEANRTKEELMALVDQYDGGSYTDRLPLIELPQLYQPSDGPRLTVSDKVEDEWPPRETPDYTWPADPATKLKIEKLVLALKDYRMDPEEIYKLYRALPAPRVPYLLSKIRHKLLHHLAVVDRKDEHSMLRYLSVMDDLKNAAIPLSQSEWTSALSFVSRYVSRPGPTEVEAALEMWREMEHKAGVKSTSTTFNVLFDVACKAGKFTLADMIYKEMEERRLEATRYHHVSIIYYHGMKRNGDGAREAYKNMVEAGEIIDTIALNAMISALIRAKEPSAAENIYERMKLAHISNSASKLMPTDFHSRRSTTKSLMLMTKMTKHDRERREELQHRSIIAPDMTTFKILVNYFAVHAGEMDKAAKLLDEMKWFSLPLHGAMFLALFKGFSFHGGIRYTEWTEERLEKVWKSFMGAIGGKEEGLYINKWMAIWILRAFAKCVGKERMLAAWGDLKVAWEPSEMDLEFVMSNMRELIEKGDKALYKNNWILGGL